MQSVADLRGYCHQSTAKGQDASLAAHSLTGDGYKFISREGFVVGKVVNTGGHILVEQTAYDIANVGDGGKRPAVLKSTQRPGQAFGKHLAQKVEIAFVTLAVHHTGAKNEDLVLVIGRMGKQIVFCLMLALSVRADRRGHHILCQHIALYTVGSSLHRGEEDKGTDRRMR